MSEPTTETPASQPSAQRPLDRTHAPGVPSAVDRTCPHFGHAVVAVLICLCLPSRPVPTFSRVVKNNASGEKQPAAGRARLP